MGAILNYNCLSFNMHDLATLARPLPDVSFFLSLFEFLFIHFDFPSLLALPVPILLALVVQLVPTLIVVLRLINLA